MSQRINPKKLKLVDLEALFITEAEREQFTDVEMLPVIKAPNKRLLKKEIRRLLKRRNVI